MKKTTAALLAVLCALLSGCSLNGGDRKPISVSYSAMFNNNNQNNAPETERETVTEQANAAAPVEGTPSEKSSSNSSNSAAGASAETAQAPKQSGASVEAPKQSAAPGQTSAESKPAAAKAAPASAARAAGDTTSAPQSTAPPKMPTGKNATGKDPAAVAIGGVCYLPYKVPEPEPEESKPSTDSETESGSESQASSKPNKEPTKYDYGYRVVFRTSSETYLMGITPYKNCTWNDLNSVCAEIGEQLETECEVIGAPSLEDLKMFTEAGVYFPEKHEIWTSTLTAEKGFKAYYRNSKGTFYATKSTSQMCGAVAIIKVKTSQSNAELLSNSQPNFNELKAQLDKEEAAFKAATSKTTSN